MNGFRIIENRIRGGEFGLLAQGLTLEQAATLLHELRVQHGIDCRIEQD